jgi:hypothetical protein
LFLRGRSSHGLKKDSAPKSVGRKLALVLLLYAVIGVLALMFIGQPLFLLSVYLHAMTLMFLGMFVASSAGEILFNREEADILMHRPIDARALLWAKVRVLAEVSIWLAGAFNLAGLFIGSLAADGSWWFLPAHALSTVMQAFFCTGTVVLVYQLCLRWFGRERLEGLMTTAQVLLTVGAVLASQSLPFLFDIMERGDDLLGSLWWIVLLPPAWFAGIDDAFAGSGATSSWLLATAGCLATAVVLWLAFGKLAGDYETGMQMLNENSSRRITNGGGRRWIDRLLDLPPLSWWLRDPRERATFLLTAAYLARDRDVKLRVYPGIAPFLILPFVFMFQSFAGGEGIGDGFGVFLSSAYVGVIPLMCVNMLQFSAHWRAADLFRAAPLPGPAPLCHGTRKAVLLLLTLPIVIIIALGTVFIRDPAALTLLLPGLFILPILALLPSMGGRAVPLSQPSEEAKSATRGLAIMGTMMATMALAGVAMLARYAGWLGPFLAVELVAVVVVYVVMKRSVDGAPWPVQE